MLLKAISKFFLKIYFLKTFIQNSIVIVYSIIVSGENFARRNTGSDAIPKVVKDARRNAANGGI